MNKPNGQGELAVQHDIPPMMAPVTPMILIERAAAGGASIEQMQQLFELKLRVEADEAKKAYHQAFSRFKAEGVHVIKNVTVTDGPLKGKKHVDLFGAVTAIIPALSKHGLSHAWKLTKDDPAWMEVTCTITHDLGHSESVSMGGAPDTGPGRNAIQARGSAKTYLERYTLMAAVGLAATDADDDGRAAGDAASLDDDDFVSLRDAILDAPDDDALKKRYLTAVEAAKKISDEGSVRKFSEAKNTRYRSLHGGAR